MPEPAFDIRDRVNPPAAEGLPEELKGKTPEELVKYFAERERTLRVEIENLQRQPPAPVQPVAPPPAPQPDAMPSSQDFWSDPVAATKKIVAAQGVTKEEFQRRDTSSQQTLIDAARLVAKDRIPDFAKYENEVTALINMAEPHLRASPQLWQMSFTYVKGLHTDQLVAEATARGKLPAEPVSPAPLEPLPKKELTEGERHVAEKMGISDEKFLKAKENMEAGRWPITLSNIQR